MEQIKQRILQWQLLAEQYKRERQNVFIKEWNGDLHFCTIMLVSETKVVVNNYDPEQRRDTRDEIDWLNIQEFDRVKKEVNENGKI